MASFLNIFFVFLSLKGNILLTDMEFYVKICRVFKKRGENIMGDEPCHFMRIYNLINNRNPLFI